MSAELARCDAESRELAERPDQDSQPAYLVAMGLNDWEVEKKLIEEENRWVQEDSIQRLTARSQTR